MLTIQRSYKDRALPATGLREVDARESIAMAAYTLMAADADIEVLEGRSPLADLAGILDPVQARRLLAIAYDPMHFSSAIVTTDGKVEAERFAGGGLLSVKVVREVHAALRASDMLLTRRPLTRLMSMTDETHYVRSAISSLAPWVRVWGLDAAQAAAGVAVTLPWQTAIAKSRGAKPNASGTAASQTNLDDAGAWPIVAISPRYPRDYARDEGSELTAEQARARRRASDGVSSALSSFRFNAMGVALPDADTDEWLKRHEGLEADTALGRQGRFGLMGGWAALTHWALASAIPALIRSRPLAEPKDLGNPELVTTKAKEIRAVSETITAATVITPFSIVPLAALARYFKLHLDIPIVRDALAKTLNENDVKQLDAAVNTLASLPVPSCISAALRMLNPTAGVPTRDGSKTVHYIDSWLNKCPVAPLFTEAEADLVFREGRYGATSVRIDRRIRTAFSSPTSRINRVKDVLLDTFRRWFDSSSPTPVAAAYATVARVAGWGSFESGAAIGLRSHDAPPVIATPGLVSASLSDSWDLASSDLIPFGASYGPMTRRDPIALATTKILPTSRIDWQLSDLLVAYKQATADPNGFDRRAAHLLPIAIPVNARGRRKTESRLIIDPFDYRLLTSTEDADTLGNAGPDVQIVVNDLDAWAAMSGLPHADFVSHVTTFHDQWRHLLAFDGNKPTGPLKQGDPKAPSYAYTSKVLRVMNAGIIAFVPKFTLGPVIMVDGSYLVDTAFDEDSALVIQPGMDRPMHDVAPLAQTDRRLVGLAASDWEAVTL